MKVFGDQKSLVTKKFSIEKLIRKLLENYWRQKYMGCEQIQIY